MSNITVEEITQKYFTSNHFKNLESYLKRGLSKANTSFPYIVSFREAGKYTLFMLDAGAAAKPHSVLGKTIKDSSVKHADDIDQPLLKFLYGLAATRDEKSGKITGLVLVSDRKIKETVPRKNNDLIKFISDVTSFSTDDLIAIQKTLKSEKDPNLSPEEKKANKMYNEAQIFKLMREKNGEFNATKYAYKYYTGDYDMHDLISKIYYGPIVSESYDEKMAIADMNRIMLKGTQYYEISRQRFKVTPTCPVQHGPQYNYIAHMFSKEPNNELDPNVANPSFPILAVNLKGQNIDWTEIHNEDEYEKYYIENYLNMKSSWLNDPDYIKIREGKSLNDLYNK